MSAQQLLLKMALALSLSSAGASCASSDSPPVTDDDAPETDDDDDDDDGPSAGGADASKGGANVKVDSGTGGNRKVDAGGANKPSDSGAKSDRPTDGGAKTTSDGGTGSAGNMPPADDKYPHPDGYVDLAIKPGTPFDPAKGDTHPMSGYTPPAGWTWYNIEGAKCRDGSPFGVMAHWSATKSTKLFFYFEGGGACANPGFCTLNPANVNHQFNGKGQLAIASTSLVNVPQDPGKEGIFNFGEAQNPYKDWNFVYIPYCTGDVHFGAKPEGKIEGVTGTLNFSGAANSKAVIARALATWPDTTRFIAGGSSAGGYGAGLNYGVIQDSFAKAEGSVILDASPPFSNEFAPACLQKRWREAWALDANIPSDCGEQCKSADGGNLFNIVDYWRAKYPKTRVALVSGIHDEIIRLFFSLGNNDCKDYQALDPVLGFIGSIGQTYDPAKFKAGLLDLRTRYESTGQLATYYQDGLPNATLHQCLFDPRIYTEAAGAGKGTIASFFTEFTNNKMLQVGP